MDEHNAVVAGERSTSEHNDFHYLRLITRTKEEAPRVEFIWNHLKEEDYYFDDFHRNNEGLWLHELMQPNSEHYEFGDDGYCRAENIVPKLNANVHFAVWGKRPVSEVLAAGRELITHLFKEYNLIRVSAFCPVTNKQAVRFATLLRFRYEGEFRSSFLYHGEYIDMPFYGLLRKEWFRREVN